VFIIFNELLYSALVGKINKYTQCAVNHLQSSGIHVHPSDICVWKLWMATQEALGRIQITLDRARDRYFYVM